jgi:hypothetical protein
MTEMEQKVQPRDQSIRDVFQSVFRFGIDAQVRHKADTKDKHGISADMGMLVIKRFIVEAMTGDGDITYEKMYQCRLIKYSGSGDVVTFNEHELMSIQEWMEESVKQENEFKEIREIQRDVEKLVYGKFNVQKGEEFKLKNKPPECRFKASGFKGKGNVVKNYELNVREVTGLLDEGHSFYITDPADIIKIEPNA